MNKSILALMLSLGAATLPTSLLAAPVCSATIDGTDAMAFSVSSLSVSKSCPTFTITLHHTGKLPVAAMGHNVVIAGKNDMAGVLADGMKAGPSNQYLKPNDPRVLVFSPLIGGGQTTQISFKPSKLPPSPVFFCSFPGHASMMKGEVVLVP